MSVRRYLAPTSREALAQAKRELGPDAVILSNKRTSAGIEVCALADGDLDRMIAAPAKPQAEAKTFKEFVAQAYGSESPVARDNVKRPPKAASKPLAPVAPAATKPAVEVASPVTAAPAAPGPSSKEVSGELAELRRQISALAWDGLAVREPSRSTVARTLLEAGFSGALARHVSSKASPELPVNRAAAWVEDVLTRNIACAGDKDLVETGGAFAFVGPTGVGKTTTVAKVAARAVVRFGAAKVALIAADGYRIGAQDQLRTYSKILGVPLATAHDAASLAQALDAFKDRHLVLIDTAGLGPRDPRVADLTTLLDHARVRKILLLAAQSQPETLELSVQAYGKGGLTGAVLTKLDEAMKLGAVLDTVLRHRLTVHFACNGQRVPEDLHPARSLLLANQALRAAGKAEGSIDEEALRLRFAA